MPESSRPASVVLVSLALLGLSVFSAVAGLGATWASNCCGSRDGADGSYAFVGLLVAFVLGVAATRLWRCSMTLREVAGATLGRLFRR